MTLYHLTNNGYPCTVSWMIPASFPTALLNLRMAAVNTKDPPPPIADVQCTNGWPPLLPFAQDRRFAGF